MANRSTETPRVARGKWVAMLHRKPTRWDVLFHKLADAVIRRYWYCQAHFSQPTFRLDSDELWDAAMQMARAFQKQTSLAAVSQMTGEKQLSIFDLNSDTLDALAAEARKVMLLALLNYAEVSRNAFVPRNHADLEALRPRLEETILRFLRDKCFPDGELYPCIENPLGDDEGYFASQNPFPADPPNSSGNARLDAYRLNILVHDEDDAALIKRKLLAFAQTDPFLAPEFAVYMVTGLADAEVHAQKTDQKINQQMESIRLRDSFLFMPCRQRGLSPIELFLEQQLMASERQKTRLRRWADEHLESCFKIIARDEQSITLKDLGADRTLIIRDEDLSIFPPPVGTYFRSRVVPWDDHFRFSGMQQTYKITGVNLAEADRLFREDLHPLRVRRKLDENDPRLLAARRLVAFAHDRFVARFGHEVARFANLAECRIKLGEFHHELIVEAKLPDGRQFADAWRADVEMEFPSYQQDRFASEEADVSSPAVIYDAVEGMAFLGNFEDLAQALTGAEVLPRHREAVKLLLVQSWKPGWLVRRMLMENPARGEMLLQEILGGGAFSIERNLDPLLGRLKCPAHTLPHRPTPFLTR